MSYYIKTLFISLLFIICIFLSLKNDLTKATLSNEVVNLNFNENPFDRSPLILPALQKALKNAAIYPDKAHDAFITKLAEYHHVQQDQLLVENGLSSILRLVAETFLGNEKTLIVADPTFDSLASYAKERGAKIVRVPLRDDYSHDLDSMLAQVDSSTKLIYICNPNNPTGTITPRDQIEDFLDKLPQDVYVFIDEAYHHFAVGSPQYISFIEKPIKDDRLIIGRTFSKIYGLAGMRLGYACSTANTIQKLKKYQATDSNNVAALMAGLAALDDESWMIQTINKFNEIRDEFYLQAAARGLKYIPTHANFIMLDIEGRSFQSVLEHFAKHKIMLGREFPPMHGHVRISFGLPEQMELFWLVWDKLPAN